MRRAALLFALLMLASCGGCPPHNGPGGPACTELPDGFWSLPCSLRQPCDPNCVPDTQPGN